MTELIEVTKYDYTRETYGEGPPPEGVFLVPDEDGPYLTADKRYPVIAHHAWTYTFRDDIGHLRVHDMVSGTSAHLPEQMRFDEDPPRKRCGIIRVWRPAPAGR